MARALAGLMTGPWEVIAHEAVTLHKAVQKESELAALLELLATDVRPRTVLEIGSDLGGSLYAWGALPSVEQVYAVTLPPPPGYTADYHGASVILSNSHAATTKDLLYCALGAKPVDFLFIDGDHSARSVDRDLDYSDVVDPNGLIVLHDIVIHPQFPDCRVHEVWARILSRFPLADISEIVHEPRTWGGFGLIRW